MIQDPANHHINDLGSGRVLGHDCAYQLTIFQHSDLFSNIEDFYSGGGK